ncbi:MAG: DUF2851 family protein [Dehalococcoidia bacterium]
MITRNRIGLPEKQVALIWQQVIGKVLTATEGEQIRVIYPGRANGDSGPDFRDAVIVNESHLMQGDVEVHARSGDWYRHGHHHDAEYNSIILHVAMWPDCRSTTLLQSGKPVPLLCLAQALRHQGYLLPYRLHCFQVLNRMDGQTLAGLLDAAGEERFKQKAMHFQTEILRPDSIGPQKKAAGQVLFRAMMRALGYAKNTKPFEELARRVPLNSIQAREGLMRKQALLLGTAGLLPSQRCRENPGAEPEVRELERIWRWEGKRIKPMSATDWSLSHIYPNNSPVRRIVAQSYLLERYCEEDLLTGIWQLVKEAPLPGGHRTLENGLSVAGDGYWRDHFDFDVGSTTKTPRIKYGALLGSSKAGEIVVNVILPFAFARGEQAGELELMKKAMELYLSYPKLAENAITRHMTNQLCPGDLSGFTACHQQGLIHIFRNYCRQGRCSQCPLAG